MGRTYEGMDHSGNRRPHAVHIWQGIGKKVVRYIDRISDPCGNSCRHHEADNRVRSAAYFVHSSRKADMHARIFAEECDIDLRIMRQLSDSFLILAVRSGVIEV